MEERNTPSALISTDPAFRSLLRQALIDSGRPITIGCEITEPLTQIDPGSVSELKRVNPELVFLDLEQDPSLGIQFAQFLAESNPRVQFISVGPVLQPELLMQAMRAGVTEYLPKPVSLEELSSALDRLARKLGISMDGAVRVPGKLFVTFSVKGGSGTTTVATNLAIRLQQLTGKKTLLVDLNLELGEIALFLGMQPRYTFIDLIRNLHRVDADLLASYLEQHDSGVYLLAGPQDPGMAEGLSPAGIHQVLGFLRQHHDYVVVDTSKSFGHVTMAALEQADEVLLVTHADLPSLRNIKRTLPVLERLTGRSSDKVRLVLNRYQPDDLIPLKDVQSTLGIEVYATLANDYEAVIRSINSGKPVALDRKSKFNSDLGALGERVAGVGAAAKNGRKGPLGSIKKLLGLKKDQGAAHE